MKKILWLETGGTIACEETSGGLMPLSSLSELVRGDAAENLVPDGVTVSRQQVLNMDSTNIKPLHWQQIAQQISDSYAEFDGFVVTHGTDTMQYTAAALSLMLECLGKPVILTGSQKPFLETGSDAPFNFRTALVAARDIPRGVYVTFCGRIIDGKSSYKLYSRSDDAFIDVEGDKGKVTSSAAQLYQLPSLPEGEFALLPNLCEQVICIKMTPTLSADVIEFIGRAGYKGVVLEGFGLGGIPSDLLDALSSLTKSGVRVIVVSACIYEGADLDVYAVGKDAASLGLECGEKMTASMAMVKLMHELAYN